MLSRFANASCADMRDKKSLDKLGTLTPDFPTQKPTELANSRDCPMEEKTWYCNKTYKQKPNRNVEDHMSDFNIIHIKQKHDCKQNGNIEKNDRKPTYQT